MPPRSVSPPQPQPTSALARSASLLSLGAVASRVLGLLREMVITVHFGASGLVSAFTVASSVPTMFYDFLIGGMLSAALVPVLSNYARPAAAPPTNQSEPPAARRVPIPSWCAWWERFSAWPR